MSKKEILFTHGPFTVTFETVWCWGDCVVIHEPIYGSLDSGGMPKVWKIRPGSHMPEWWYSLFDHDGWPYCSTVAEAALRARAWCAEDIAEREGHAAYVNQELERAKIALSGELKQVLEAMAEHGSKL